MSLNEVLNRLKFISNYNPKIGGQLNEWGYKPDITNFIMVGHCGSSFYLYADPEIANVDYDKISNKSNFKEKHMSFMDNKEKRGAVYGMGIPTYNLSSLEFYPEYQHTIYEYLFFGKPKQATEKQLVAHNELMNKCFIVGEELILHHNSPVRITDGIIKRGTPQLYTPRTFHGICFWASKNNGPDPSNGGKYTYWCKIRLNKAYDVANNIESIRNDVELHKKYPYELRLWDRGDKSAVTCVTDISTPIWCVSDSSTGKFYDAQWNEIEKPNILN